MRLWGVFYSTLALVSALAGASRAVASEATLPCSRLVAHGDTTPFDADGLTRLFGLPPEAFRRQACQDPRKLFTSMMGMAEPAVLAALVGASPNNFHWYHSTFLLRLAGELSVSQASVAPRRLDTSGDWTPALEAKSLDASSQRKIAEFLARTGRTTGPPKPLLSPWQDLYAADWFAGTGLAVHYGPVFAQVRGIRERDGTTDFYDQAWFLQAGRQGALLALYGTLTEGWLYADAPNRIPGPAISVGGKAHADFWDVSYGTDGTLVVESLGETKSSIHGYANGGRKQVRRFLDALTQDGADLRLYGHPVDTTKLRFRGADGELLDAAAVRERLVLDGWRDARMAQSDGAMPQDAKDGHWEDQFVPRFRQTFGAGFFQIVLPSDEARLVESNRKYLGSFVGTVVAGKMTLEELRDWFAHFVTSTFVDREISRRTLDELVFADEDTERRVTLHLDVGTRRNGPRVRKVTELAALPPTAPALVDERFAQRDYDAVLEATFASQKTLAAVEKNADAREALRLCLKRLGFRALFQPDGTLRPVTLEDGELRIGAVGRARALTVRWVSGAKPAIDVLRTGAVLTLPPGPAGREALADANDIFWDAGLVGHDLQRYTPGAWLRQERMALGEPAVVLKPGQAAEEEAFAAEAAMLTADAPPLRRFFLAPPAYGKTITLARSAARLAALPRPAPGRGILLAVTGQEPVLDQIAEELEQQLPRNGKLRFVPRNDRALRKDMSRIVRYSAEGDVVVPILWSELNALRKEPAAFAGLAAALRGVFIDEAQELDDKVDARATLDALTQGQTGIVVAGYSASALRESIVSADGPFGGRLFPVYPELRTQGLAHAILEAQKRAMREGMITPLRANDEGRVITYFHPKTIVDALPESELIAQFRAVRGIDPDPDEIARVREEAAEALVGSDRYKTLSAEARAVGWLATVRLMHGEGLLTQERGFFRFKLRAQAEDFHKVLEAYGTAKKLGLRFGQYFHNSPNRDALLAGIRSEDPATRVDWLVTCFLMDVGVDATPLSAAVLFTQEVDPELFAQVGGRPMRLHDGKRFAHWWHIAKEPLSEEGLLLSLGKKGEALEKVALNGPSVTVKLVGATQGPNEPIVVIPPVIPLDAKTLTIPDGALDDLEQVRYRLLAAAHQRVLFADAKSEDGALADLLDFARVTTGLRAVLNAPPEKQGAVGQFVVAEAEKILRGRRKRHTAKAVAISVFGRVLEGMTIWEADKKPANAATWLATLALLDIELLEQSLRRTSGEDQWPIRLRDDAVLATRAIDLESKSWPLDPLPTIVERLDALGLPGERPRPLAARFRSYLELRMAAHDQLANDDDNQTKRPEDALVLADKLERAIVGHPDIWAAFDRIAASFRPVIQKCMLSKFLAALTSEAPPVEGLGIVHFPVDMPTVLRELGSVDNATLDRWIATLENIHRTGRSVQDTYSVWLTALAGTARKYFVYYSEYVLGWSRRDQPLPPWETALADLKRLRKIKIPRSEPRAQMKTASERPFERAFDPTLEHTFELPTEAEVLSEAERAEGFDTMAAYRQAALEWLTNGEDIVAAEEVAAAGPAHTPPTARRYAAVEQLLRKTTRVVALYRRLPEAAQTRLGVKTGDEFARALWDAARQVGVAVLDAGHPATGYEGRGPILVKKAALALLGGTAILDPSKPADRSAVLRAMPQENLESLRRLIDREHRFFKEMMALAGGRAKQLTSVFRPEIASASQYRDLLFAPTTAADYYPEWAAALDREVARRARGGEEEPEKLAPLEWKRPERPRELGKETPEEARLWAKVDALFQSAVALNQGDAASVNDPLFIAGQLLAMLELRARFDDLRGKPGVVRREEDALIQHFVEVCRAISQARGSQLPVVDWRQLAPEGRANLLLESSDSQFVGFGPEAFAWAVAARRAIRAGKPIEGDAPGVSRFELKTALAPFPVSEDLAAALLGKAVEGGLLPETAKPDDWLGAVDLADQSIARLGASARQELRRRLLGRGNDALFDRWRKSAHATIQTLIKSAEIGELFRMRVLLGDDADPEAALRWFSSFAREWVTETQRLRRNRETPPTVQAVEALPQVYSGLAGEEFKRLQSAYRGSAKRAARDPSRIDLPKLTTRESAILHAENAARWSDLGILHGRLRNLDKAVAVAEKVVEGALPERPWDAPEKVPPPNFQLVAEGFVPEAMFPRLPPTVEELSTATETPMTPEAWQRAYLGWVFAPSGLEAREAAERLLTSHRTQESYVAAIDGFYGSRVAQALQLFARLPAGHLPVMRGTREAFLRSNAAYLQALFDRVVAILSGKLDGPAEPPPLEYKDLASHRSLQDRLSLLGPEVLRWLRAYILRMDADLDDIAGALGVDWRKDRRWLEAAFGNTELHRYFADLAPMKSTPLPKTHLEALALVDAALASPAGDVLGPPPFRFEATLRSLADGKSKLGKRLRELEAYWVDVHATGLSDEERHARRMIWGGLAIGIIFGHRTELANAPLFSVYEEIETVLPEGHPWRKTVNLLGRLAQGEKVGAIEGFEQSDPYFYQWSLISAGRLGDDGIAIGNLVPPVAMPMDEGSKQPLPVAEATAREVVAALGRAKLWSPPADLADKPLDAYIAAFEYARAKTVAFRTVVYSERRFPFGRVKELVEPRGQELLHLWGTLLPNDSAIQAIVRGRAEDEALVRSIKGHSATSIRVTAIASRLGLAYPLGTNGNVKFIDGESTLRRTLLGCADDVYEGFRRDLETLGPKFEEVLRRGLTATERPPVYGQQLENLKKALSVYAAPANPMPTSQLGVYWKTAQLVVQAKRELERLHREGPSDADFGPDGFRLHPPDTKLWIGRSSDATEAHTLLRRADAVHALTTQVAQMNGPQAQAPQFTEEEFQQAYEKWSGRSYSVLLLANRHLNPNLSGSQQSLIDEIETLEAFHEVMELMRRAPATVFAMSADKFRELLQPVANALLQVRVEAETTKRLADVSRAKRALDRSLHPDALDGPLDARLRRLPDTQLSQLATIAEATLAQRQAAERAGFIAPKDEDKEHELLEVVLDGEGVDPKADPKYLAAAERFVATLDGRFVEQAIVDLVKAEIERRRPSGQ